MSELAEALRSFNQSLQLVTPSELTEDDRAALRQLYVELSKLIALRNPDSGNHHEVPQ